MARDLFLGFARGWADAARLSSARLVIATPSEDRPAWERALDGTRHPIWIFQRGHCLGARLEDSARQAAALGGHAVLVGGDVLPSATALLEAFEGLEGGAEASVSPAPDGGVSLVALAPADVDLLRRMRPRVRTVLRDLLFALAARGRSVRVVPPIPDVDGRTGLRSLLRSADLPASLLVIAWSALLRPSVSEPTPPPDATLRVLHGPPVLRGPPPAA